VSSRALVATACGLCAYIPGRDALTVGQAIKLAADLLAVRLVIPPDFPDESAGALARHPLAAAGAAAFPPGSLQAHLGPRATISALLDDLEGGTTVDAQ
jgi:hypothetical protein